MRRLLCVAAGILIGAVPAASPAVTCSPTVFIEALAYPAGANARTMAVADFNADTEPDVVTANVGPRSVSVLLNDGTGGLESPIATFLPEDPVAIAAADLRGNGTMDVVVATYDGVFVLLGHGDGTFDAAVFYPSGTYNVSSMVVGKFDANSSPDIVVGSYYSSNATSLLPGNGNGTFGTALSISTTVPAFSLAAGDFQADGYLDLVTSGGDSGFVFVYPGLGDGTFAPGGVHRRRLPPRRRDGRLRRGRPPGSRRRQRRLRFHSPWKRIGRLRGGPAVSGEHRHRESRRR